LSFVFSCRILSPVAGQAASAGPAARFPFGCRKDEHQQHRHGVCADTGGTFHPDEAPERFWRTGVKDSPQPRNDRLFAALDIPDAVKAALIGLKPSFPGLKWVPAANLHLTLRFIGQTPRERTEPVRRSLRGVRGEAFRLTVAGLGLFPRRTGGLLWAGVREEPALRELKRKIDEVLRSRAGLRLKDEPFSPHLTLSRLKCALPPDMRDLVRANAAVRFGEFPVTAFTLFRSLLRPTGAIHEPVERYLLGGEP
jgi:2'-5' RNA ligase